MSDFIQNVLLIGGVILVAILCAASLKTSTKLRRWRATKLADDLDMELLASDNPNTLLVAGEINNRPSSIRYNKEKTSHRADKEELLVSVDCHCAINFKVVTTETAINKDDQVSVAMLASSGLYLESKQKDKAAFIFEEPETVQSLIDLISSSGAKTLDVSGNKVSALILDNDEIVRSPARISATLELLDRFARLLEFVANEQHAAEN